MDIYVLIDCDGDMICAFKDQDKAIKEAEDCGCEMVILELHD